MNSRLWILAIAGISFILDQLSKVLAEKLLALEPPAQLIPGFLSLTFVQNINGAFGLSVGAHTKQALAVASIVVVFLVIMWIWRMRPQRLLMRICFGLILGGAIGNLYDRIFRDGVIDFIDIQFGEVYNWPTFNLADVWLCVGAVLIIWEMLFHQPKQKSAPPTDQSSLNP